MSDNFKPLDIANTPKTGTFDGWSNQNLSQPEEKVEMITPQELESIKKQAYDEAYQQGLTQAQAEINEKVQIFASLANKLINPLLILDEELEKEVIQLVTWLVKQVLNAELTIEPQKLLGVFDQLKTLLPQHNKVTNLFLNAEDHKIIAEVGELVDIELEMDKIQVDPKLLRGEFTLETIDGELDATINARLQELVMNILESHNQGTD